jgi:outer membrane protein, multidrug efflux system
MRLHGRKRAPLRIFAAALVLFGFAVLASPALAGPFDLDDDDDDAKKKPAPAASSASSALGGHKRLDEEPPPPIATIKPHAYTLLECLALAERNHPNLWAARARLAVVHAQLDEAKWTPFSYWSSQIGTGVLPPLGGTPFYNAVPRSLLNQGIGSGYEPFIQFGVRGSVPLYTFGKIDSIRRAAEAQVRFNEWDLEKARQLVRMDVRRAYFGLMLSRDALYIADEVLPKIDDAIRQLARKIAAGDPSIDEVDKLRLEISRDELVSRIAEARRGGSFAVAGLRFLTGVQTAFDIPDEPLKVPGTPLGPVVRYLTAARLFRADVNLARSGVVARRAQLDFARAQLFPNIGLSLGFNYSFALSATPQNTAWIGDPYNGFGAGFVFGVDWGLDLLPKSARVNAAESQLEEARALERLALGGVAVEVENAYATAVEAKTREETWDRAEHRAKRWISMVQDAIDLGTKDERALWEPLRVYVYSRANHAVALMDFNIALSELARVTGWDAAAPLL